MDEESDGSAPVTREDSGPNNLDLTDVNTAPSNAGGKISNCALLAPASLEYFSKSDTSLLEFASGGFTLSAWVYLTSTGSTGVIASKWISTGNQREYGMDYDSVSSRYRFYVSTNGSGGGSQTTVSAATFGAPTQNTWHMVTAGRDAVNNVIWIQVDAGTRDTTAFANGNSVFAGTGAFGVGAYGAGGTYVPARLDEIGVWGKCLTTSEVTELYNANSGKTYPF